MSTSAKSVHEAVEIFRQKATVVYSYVDANVASQRFMSDEDDFAFISLAFLHKFLLHAESVSLLCAEGLVSDAGIIARSMLEGLIYLAWMDKDKQVRARKYRHFAAVEDFRQIRKAEKRGANLPKEVHERTNVLLQSLDDSFLNRKAKSNQLKPADDPYQKGWNYDENGVRVEIRDMVREIGDELLKELYDDLSQWSHWTIQGVGRNLKRTDKSVRMSAGNEYDAIRAFSSVVIALVGAAIAVDNHFSGKHAAVLDSFRSELVAELRRADNLAA